MSPMNTGNSHGAATGFPGMQIARSPLGFVRLTFIWACIVVVGCSTMPYVPGAPIQDAAREQALRESVAGQYPRQFRAVHRVVLTVRGRQFSLDGYLRADRSTGFRLLAVAGFGGSLFELAWSEEHGPIVVQSNGILQDDRLLAGPVEDVRTIFFNTPSPEARLEARDPGTLALVDTLPDGTIEEYLFDGATSRLLHFVRAKNGQIHYSIEYLDPGLVGDWAYPLPRRIRVDHPKLKYEVDIRLVAFGPDKFDPSVLRLTSDR